MANARQIQLFKTWRMAQKSLHLEVTHRCFTLFRQHGSIDLETQALLTMIRAKKKAEFAPLFIGDEFPRPIDLNRLLAAIMQQYSGRAIINVALHHTGSAFKHLTELIYRVQILHDLGG